MPASPFLGIVQLTRPRWVAEYGGMKAKDAIRWAKGLVSWEAVLTPLATSPGPIDDIDRLVKRLTATERGREVLPDGWDAF